MSIPTHKGQPTPSGQCRYWGLPYHGLVRDGVMTLPNGATRTYPQPIGGSTVVVKNPRKAGLPATRPLASYDQAQGFSWLTFAILAGQSKQLAGVNLGDRAFIYIDHRDRAWLMDVIATTGGDHFVRVLRRFGLFGQDSVSWIENRTIYSGDFNATASMTEYLPGDDLCQNWDGSSVFLNFRSSLRFDRLLSSLTRVVELNVASSDAGSQNDVTFTVHFSDRFATADLYTVTNSQYDTRPVITGWSCGEMRVASCDYSYDERLSSLCGPGIWRTGVYVEQGSIAAYSVWEDGSGTYGDSSRTTIVMKVWWDHANQENVMTLVRGEQSDHDYISTCVASYAESFSITHTVPDNGDVSTPSGLPCSGLATISWEVTTTGGTHSGWEYTHRTVWYGGIYINDMPAIRWVRRDNSYSSNFGSSDCNFSESGSYMEGETQNWPYLLDQVRADCMTAVEDGIVNMRAQSSDGGNSTMSSDISTVIDGVEIPDSPDLSYTNDWIRAYGNTAFSLVLISKSYPEGDPQAPDYCGQYGLVVEGKKILSGRITDRNFYVTANPVDGAVTVDAADNVCYA